MAPLPERANAARVAEARERFLTAEPVDRNQVRDTILASWQRSRRENVAADKIDLSYVRDPDLDTPLTRSALPILRRLRENLDGQPISVILTDAAGIVLTRMTADSDLDRHLDGVKLAPGFSYAEGAVGTNGIGTALEGGGPAQVFGHEHYAEHLEMLACAGVPIHHPVTGKTVGAVDLTCWNQHADALLATLARTTADQITAALLADSSGNDVELLQEYRRTCRRTPGIVFALNNDVIMMSDSARQLLDPGDQVVLIGHAAEALAERHSAPIMVDLPTGTRARMQCRPVEVSGTRGPTAGVVQVKLVGSGVERVGGEPHAVPATYLPGLVGTGPLWLRACRHVDTVYQSGEWLDCEGEPGVGKLAVIRAVHQRRDPAGRFRVLDAAEPADRQWLTGDRELLEGDGTLVIRHVDRLGTWRLRSLAGMLKDTLTAGPRSLWVAVTRAGEKPSDELADLLRYFPSTVELPPLRHHVADLQELVPHLLARLHQGGRLSCSPEAMQLLLRSSWPGNTEQLWQVLRQVVQHRRTGLIQPDDLPPECRTVSRRLLRPLESMERDAIVQSLIDHDGNKIKAAESLGMSRATIYRKIHDYGIVVSPT